MHPASVILHAFFPHSAFLLQMSTRMSYLTYFMPKEEPEWLFQKSCSLVVSKYRALHAADCAEESRNDWRFGNLLPGIAIDKASCHLR